MKHLFSIVCLVIAFGMMSIGVYAAQTNYKIGEIAGPELKIGTSARFVACGEAGIARVDDLNAIAMNPAGLASAAGTQLSFMHNVYLEDTSLENLAFSQSLFKDASMGINVMYLNFGEMDRVTVDSNSLPVVEDSFTPNVIVGKVGYGQKFSNLLVGAALKMYSLNIDTESYTSIAIDLGAQYQVVKSLSAAVTVENLGTSVADSSLAMLAKVGVAYTIPANITVNDDWSLMLDVNLPFGDVNYTSLNIGTEYWYNKVVALRAGYKIKDTGELGGITGLTAGLGGKLMLSNVALNLDYAMVSFGDLGLTHQVSIGAGF